MGIPSYYKRLADRFPRLIQDSIKTRTDILFMDFNCLIYNCVRGEGVPPYTKSDPEAHATWERALLERVKANTIKVWEAAGRPAEVFLGVDGVVPMAKIRQQRLRRFKSLWMAGAEEEAGVRKKGVDVWDTNAITPGTEFMEKLTTALRNLATAKGTGWTVSGAEEAGEGEQKIMQIIRQKSGELKGKHIVVYGLDADLIVLSLLHLARVCPEIGSWTLLRESTEFGTLKTRTPQKGEYRYLDIKELLQHICERRGRMSIADYMMEYTCAMSFLGNDFLPHSLSVHLRDGGHDTMLNALQNLHEKGRQLVVKDRVQSESCWFFIKEWAALEEEWISQAFIAKYKMRTGPPRNETERLMSGVQNLPLEWKEEHYLWNPEKGFLPDWKECYRGRWLRGADEAIVCREYKTGLQWILDYYTGKPVSYKWYYPWNLPPLWESLHANFKSTPDIFSPLPSLPVAPQEQLAMVLPVGSWGLVRNPSLRMLPTVAPVYWPSHFSFFSAGKRFMWECEAELPILTIDRMRSLLV